MVLIRKYIVVLALFLSLLSSKAVQAQWPQQFKFHEREGLVCGKIFQLLSDSRHYIWIASEHGLFRYDGFQFQKFSTNDGLPSNTIVDVLERDGEIVAVSKMGTIAIFNGQEFTPHPLNKFMGNLSQGNYPISKSLAFTDHIISLSFYDLGTYVVDSTGVIYEASKDQSFPDLMGFLYNSTLAEDLVGDIEQYLKKHHKQIINNPWFIPGNITLNQESNQHFLNYGSFSLQFNNGELKHAFSQNPISSVGMVNDENYVAFEQGGIVFETKEGEATILPSLTVTHCIVDHENGIWISTNNNGLFYVRNLSVRNFNYSTNFHFMNVGDMAITPKGNMFIAHNTISVDLVTREGIFLNTINTHHRKKINSLTYSPKDKVLLGVSDKKLITISFKENSYSVKNHPTHKVNNIVTCKDTVFVSSMVGVYYYDEFKSRLNPYFSKKSANQVRLFSADNRKWMVSDHVLYEIVHKKLIAFHPDIIDSSEIVDLFSVGGQIIVAARDKGLIVCRNDVVHVVKSAGLFNLTKVLMATKSNQYLFLATLDGVIAIPIENNECNYDKSLMLNRSFGISSHEFERIECTETHLYIQTRMGVDLLTIAEIKKIPTITIPKPSIEVNGKPVKYNSTIHLNDENNSIDFFYSPLFYKYLDQMKYSFFIENYYDKPIVTNSPQLSIKGLPFGKYKLHVKVCDYKGHWVEGDEIEIIRMPPIYKHSLFIVVLVLLVLLPIFLVILLNVRLARRRAELNSEKKEQVNRIISQQINPHFTFNSLNAIHHFVLTNNREDSSKYLIKFSSLMRSVFEYSEEETISLEKELEVLGFYVELEQLRFQGRFTFHVDVEPNISLIGTKITPFLLQPFVENAIRHGVVKSGVPGKIVVSFKMKNDYLYISIEDNGIGRVAAQKLKGNASNQRKRMGFSIIDQRIKRINMLTKEKTTLKIVDLYEDGEAKGTKVILLMPYVTKN
ncbi:MAG: histidine kinase [Salinivirgaceae bacterium]|nr:histidine kinase [Salinivirgaceae bacterium]